MCTHPAAGHLGCLAHTYMSCSYGTHTHFTLRQDKRGHISGGYKVVHTPKVGLLHSGARWMAGHCDTSTANPGLTGCRQPGSHTIRRKFAGNESVLLYHITVSLGITRIPCIYYPDIEGYYRCVWLSGGLLYKYSTASTVYSR